MQHASRKAWDDKLNSQRCFAGECGNTMQDNALRYVPEARRWRGVRMHRLGHYVSNVCALPLMCALKGGESSAIQGVVGNAHKWATGNPSPGTRGVVNIDLKHLQMTAKSDEMRTTTSIMWRQHSPQNWSQTGAAKSVPAIRLNGLSHDGHTDGANEVLVNVLQGYVYWVPSYMR